MKNVIWIVTKVDACCRWDRNRVKGWKESCCDDGYGGGCRKRRQRRRLPTLTNKNARAAAGRTKQGKSLKYAEISVRQSRPSCPLLTASRRIYPSRAYLCHHHICVLPPPLRVHPYNTHTRIIYSTTSTIIILYIWLQLLMTFYYCISF